MNNIKKKTMWIKKMIKIMKYIMRKIYKYLVMKKYNQQKCKKIKKEKYENNVIYELNV